MIQSGIYIIREIESVNGVYSLTATRRTEFMLKWKFIPLEAHEALIVFQPESRTTMKSAYTTIRTSRGDAGIQQN